MIVKTIGGTNSITFTVHSPSNGNTFTYNYLVTDYGTTANYAFNAVSVTITVNAAFTTAPTLTPSNTALDSGQYVTLTASGAAGGTLPYAYTFYNTTSGGAVAIRHGHHYQPRPAHSRHHRRSRVTCSTTTSLSRTTQQSA